MFNLFGSFFFGRQAAQTSNNANNETQADPLTHTSNSDASTQTASSQLTDEQLLILSHTQASEDDLQRQWVIVERARNQQLSQIATSTTHLDDVKEEDEETTQQAEMAKSEEPTEDDDDNDVLLGSFFERNQNDDSKPVEQSIAPVPTRDEWLITPLPCLTSITTSQRSLVENDPLENLLIEHPSMSVFVTVTSSAMAAETSDVLKIANYSENGKEASLSTAVVEVSQKKRKGMETNQSPQQQSPTSTMRRKANKRNKKSPTTMSPVSSPVVSAPSATVPVAATSTANKENMQVRTLLTSEFRSKTNPASKLDSILLSKNQMKRNNKHANKFNSNNCIQRKFHKLQQPVCC